MKMLRIQIFCRVSLSWESLMIRLSLWVLGKKTQKRFREGVECDFITAC